MLQSDKSITPLSFSAYRSSLLITSLLGMLVSAYLSYTHYKIYNDFSYESVCTLSQSINCDRVSESVFSHFLGVPLGMWGLISYLLICVILLSVIKNESSSAGLWSFLLLFFFFSSIISFLLAYISIKYVQSLCLFCLLIYFLNWISLFLIFLVLKRYKLTFLNLLKSDIIFFTNHFVRYALLFFFFFSTLLLLIMFYPKYWEFNTTRDLIQLPSGVTENGHPWIGAEIPEITVIEYTDYQCFACQRMHYALRKLIETYPKRLRLVHRYFPMDSCNPLVSESMASIKSCILAQIASCAQEQNVFWDVNDQLLFEYSENIKKLVSEVGVDYNRLLLCLETKHGREVVLKDITEGIQLGVVATPTFIVDGKLYKGKLPLKQILEELKRSADIQ